MARGHGLRGPRNSHTLPRLQGELLYNDADRFDSWGPGQGALHRPAAAVGAQLMRAHGRAGAGAGAAGAGRRLWP